MSWNPATLADNRYSVQLQLAAVDAHATNNAYRYTGLWSPRERGVDFLLTESQPLFNNKYYKLFSAGVNMRGPSLLVRLSPKHSIAVGTRARTAVQGNGISPDVLQDALDMYQFRGSTTGNQLNVNLNGFAEWNVSYGRVLYNEGSHFLKAGLTVKRLLGAGSGFVQGSAIAYEVGSRRYAVSDTSLRIQQFNGSYGYANPKAFADLNASTPLKWLTKGQAPGTGWGADVGLVYEWRPEVPSNRSQKADHSRNKYRLRLSGALTDIGGINYSRNTTVFTDMALREVGVNNRYLNGINLGNYATRGNAILRTSELKKQTRFTSGLPTALNVDVDYHIWSKLYANAAVSQGLRGREAIGMRHFSYATLSTRVETKLLDIGVSASRTMNYQLMAYGLMMRLGPLTIGSNNLLGLVDKSKLYGANAYVEVSLLTVSNKRLKTPKKSNLQK